MMLFFKNSSLANYEKTFYDFQINDINGEVINLKDYQGKAILLVNTASYCGFTKQYAGLQELQNTYGKQGFQVLGFPCNDFGGQEPGTIEEIKAFCSSTYKATFPIFEKVIGIILIIIAIQLFL